MLVTAPFVLLLLDYWPLSRFERPLVASKGKTAHRWNQRPAIPRLLLEKIPLLVLSAAACVVTFVLQKQEAGAIPPLPFAWRVENAFTSYVTYLWKTFWPTRLAVFYPHPNNSLPIWEVILAIAFLVAITAAAIGLRKQRGYLFTGWFWYLGMLVPVVGVVQVGSQAHADRYTYLPQIGLYLALTWMIADLAKAWRRQWILTAAATAVIALLSWSAWIQASYWRESESLWKHTLAVTANNEVAHNHLGKLFLGKGLIDEAVAHCQAAVNSLPNSPMFQANLGTALLQKGLTDEAILHFQKAMELEPNRTERAKVQSNMGNALLQKGLTDEAIVHFRQALELAPANGIIHSD